MRSSPQQAGKAQKHAAPSLKPPFKLGFFANKSNGLN